MRTTIVVATILTAGICTTAIAQNTVTIIPLNSNKAGGLEGQVQYNKGGKVEGAEIYYSETSGRVGIGETNPAESLEVNGNVKAGAFIGSGASLSGVVTSESDPTVPASVKDGIGWSEISGRPPGLDDGDDVGIQAESDPTVPANIKDGIGWTELSGRPAGLDDGDDVGILTESDPQVGTNTTDYVPKWDGTSLVEGSIYDNGDIGIGTASPSAKLEVRGEIRSTDDSGNNRLWGQGRVGATATLDTTVNGINISRSTGIAPWYAVASVCPSNTWVCTEAEVQGLDTTTDTSLADTIQCDGTSTTSRFTWVQDEGGATYGYAIFINSSVLSKLNTPKCFQIPVWCCSAAN